MIYEMAYTCPMPHPTWGSAPDNYALYAGGAVDVLGEGFIPGTLRVRPAGVEDAVARVVREDAVRERVQESLL